MAKGDWEKISKRSLITGIIGFVLVFMPGVGIPLLKIIFSLTGVILLVISMIFQIKDKSML